MQLSVSLGDPTASQTPGSHHLSQRPKVEAAKKDFLSLRPCRVDPFWTKRLQEKTRSGDMEFESIVTDFFSSLRPVSLREEQSHTIQRVIAGGEKAKALITSRQRSQSVVYSLKQNFTARGGRNLDTAPKKVSRTYLKIRNKKKDAHRRPNQMGNTWFYYLNCQLKLKGGTREEHKAAWDQLSPQGKARWTSRHHNHVRLKRGQQRQQATHTCARQLFASF